MPDKAIIVTDKSVDLASPKGLVDFAKTLKEFIIQEGLYTKIKNKNYVHVEAWQFAGAATGTVPVVKSLERIETKDPTEIKYRAEVKLSRLIDNSTIGYGVAICSNKESNYQKRNEKPDEYVIASMAQTRATGKAFRNVLGWLMKIAGYEATPAEEMDSDGSTQASGQSNYDHVKLENQVKNAKTMEDLAKLQDSLPAEIKLDTVDLFTTRLGELQDNGAA